MTQTKKLISIVIVNNIVKKKKKERYDKIVTSYRKMY